MARIYSQAAKRRWIENTTTLLFKTMFMSKNNGLHAVGRYSHNPAAAHANSAGCAETTENGREPEHSGHTVQTVGDLPVTFGKAVA